MITCSLITQRAINNDEVWRLTGRRDLTGGGDANQQVATAGEKFFRYQNGKRRAYGATNNADNLRTDRERIELCVVARPVAC